MMVLVLVGTVVLEVLFHKFFTVFYFGQWAFLKEILTCNLVAIVIVLLIFDSENNINSKASGYKEPVAEYLDEDSFGNGEATQEVESESSSEENITLPEENEQVSLNEEDTEEDIKEDFEEETVNTDEYVFAYSDSKYLTDDELSSLTSDELRLARNEIYARHGCIFKSTDLNEYFGAKSWYEPKMPVAEFSSSEFNKYELKNIEKIQSYE